MSGSFELFDHTADVGIRVSADTSAELVRAAGEGLYAVIGELETTGDPQAVRLEFSADERAILLRDYLAELLVLFECEQRIAADVEVTVFDEKCLGVIGQMAVVDKARSVFFGEVKAITYHELAVRRTENGYEATFIVDV
ncbi:MAG: archease [Phycisphaerae bacterium]|nr:archease [Phycisphaerae bacterium]